MHEKIFYRKVFFRAKESSKLLLKYSIEARNVGVFTFYSKQTEKMLKNVRSKQLEQCKENLP